MKAKPVRILWRIKSNWKPYDIERLVVVRESEHLMFLDTGSFMSRVDKRSEVQMARIFASEQEALKEADTVTFKKLEDDVSNCKKTLKHRETYLISGKRELALSEKRLAKFRPKARVK
jgi:hypothetical protein